MDLLDDLKVGIHKKKGKTYSKANDAEDEELNFGEHTFLAENLLERVKKRLNGDSDDSTASAIDNCNKNTFFCSDTGLYEGKELDDEFEAMRETYPVPKQREVEIQQNKHPISQTQLIPTFYSSGLAKTQVNTQVLEGTNRTIDRQQQDLDTQLNNEEFSQTTPDDNTLDKAATESKLLHSKETSFRNTSFTFKLTSNNNEGLLATKPNETQIENEQEVVATQLDVPEKEKTVPPINDTIEESHLPVAPLKVVRKKYLPEQFIAAFDDSESSNAEGLSNEENDADEVKEIASTQELVAKQKSIVTTMNGIIARTMKNSPQNVIELNSSSESEDEYKSKSSKAALLLIKAKRSRNKATKAKSMHVSTVDSLKELFSSLKTKNRDQILECRREISGKKGISLEAIEDEKIQVEKLLEQELERNRRVKLREKREREKSKHKSKAASSDSASDVPDSDAMESDLSLPDSDVEQHLGIHGSAGSDEDSADTSAVHKNNNPIIDDDESSSSSDDNEVTQEPIGINLGHYGDNITSSNVTENDGADQSDRNVPSNSELKLNRSHSAKLLVGEVSSDSSVNSDSSEDELDEVERNKLQERAKVRRRMEIEAAKKRKQVLKSTGLNKILEMEAEESEDEWHGVGGADGENSDDYDSDLDTMIDDFSKSKFDTASIRERLALENKEMDERMINKILHDINTGGFRKRGRGALDLELSDDEDELLRQFREKRREIMKQKLLENVDGVVNNSKSKAFFESMVEDITRKSIPAATSLSNTRDEMGKKKIVISEEFVQSSLSFLSAKDDDIHEFEVTEAANDATEDLESLKQRSNIKSLDSPQRNKNSAFFDDVDGTSLDFKLPSIVKSFSSNSDVNDKFKTGIKTVTISKSYRVASGSRSAITFLGKKRKLKAPQGQKSTPLVRKPTSSFFDSNSDSFT
ncbi:Mrc1 [Kluyveromyces lactis]|nr:Mrc1 [Kluyveromyces lactis]